MIMDLHNHTVFSYDGSNTPEEIIEHAILHGFDAVGICDHEFTIQDRLGDYIRYLHQCKEKYKKDIKNPEQIAEQQYHHFELQTKRERNFELPSLEPNQHTLV